MDSSQPQEPLESTSDGEDAVGKKEELLRLPRITPAKIDYSVDQCNKHKVLVPEILEEQSVAAAAYRMLRTRFMHRARTHEWTSIGISSPGQGEGKSVSSLNLALSAARAGTHDVFLIDLDLRRPKMWQYLGADPPLEITDYLKGLAPAEDVMFSIGVDNLKISGAVDGTTEASELLAGPLMSEMFENIKSEADNPIILVDLPPLLSTDDALIMADNVDACLLIISETRSRRDATAKALELLEDFDLAGIVLNRSKAMVSDYYTGY